MTGMLIKDILISKKYLRTMAVIMVLYAVLFGVIGNGDSSFLSSFVLIMSAFFIATTFSCDELAHWDKYALTFPISRNRMVRAKYMAACLFTLLGGGISALFAVLTAVFHQKAVAPETWLVIFFNFCLVLFLEGIALPLLYRFGPEKGRYLLIGMMLLVIVAFLLAEKSGNLQISEGQMKIISAALLPAGILFLFFSYGVSCWIYRKKEF